ncbi:MAG: tetratricopeptide repeat protein [Verrucomicrobiota bacterium]|nr:tetratricopeptide repeat protein [Verrucomicrobiota bacterium]
MKPRALYHALACTLIAAAIMFCYWSVIDADFVWDDRINLKDNPFIRSFSHVNLKWMGTGFYMGHYHPLTWLSLALDYHWYGMSASGYHLTNLILHAIGSLLVYALSWQVLGRIGPEITGLRAQLFCTAAALIFAIHPTRVESVAWITERRDVLSFVFIALFFLAWHRYVSTTTSRRWFWYSLGIVVFTLSLLSKAWGMTIPAILIALDYTYFNRVSFRFERLREQSLLWLEKLPLLALSAACAYQAFKAQKLVAMDMVRDHTLFDRTIQAGYGIIFYVWKTFIPYPLSPLYLIKDDYNPLTWPYLYCAIAGYLLVVLAVWMFLAKCARWRALLGGFFFYLITLAPVLGFAQSGQQLTADRYTYIACIPLIFAFVLWVIRRAPHRPAITGAFLGAVVIALTVLTLNQAKLWQNEVALWTHAIAHDPGNYVAHNNLGLALEDAGALGPAYEHYDKAVTLFPDYAAALYNRGNMRSQLGDRTGAMADYNAAIKNDQKMVKAYNNRGNLNRDNGDYEASLRDFDRALTLNPRYADAFYNRGLSLRALERNDEAIDDYTQAIRHNPGFVQAYNNRANIYRLLKRDEDAVADYKRAIAIKPAYFNANYNCGNALRELGRYAEAIQYYQHAFKLDPSSAATVGNIGICYWRLLKIPEAEASFRQSLALDTKDPANRFNYAQFLRDQGRRDEALTQIHIVLKSTDRTLELHRTAQAVLNQLLKPATK